jgi:hypothetical protein
MPTRVRTLLAFAARWGDRITLLCACLCIFLWFVGIVINDRYFWSQFLWWAPTPLVMLAGAGLLVFSRCCAWLHDAITSKAHARSTSRRVCAVLLGLMLIAFLFFEVHLHRAILPNPKPSADAPLRIAHWNVSIQRFPDMHDHIARMNPDIILLTNPPFFTSIQPSRDAMGQGTSAAAGGRLSVLSRYPVIAYATLSLRISGAKMRTHRWSTGGMLFQDTGDALLVLLDTTAWNGKPTCVWLLDLPSDFTIPRARVMQEAAHTLSLIQHPERDTDALTQRSSPIRFYRPVPERADEQFEPSATLRAQLATPDLIAGDFNTPRDSWSYSALIPSDMTHPARTLGWGWRRTWPQSPLPMVAIDNLFIAPTFRATYYGVHDTQRTQHLAQILLVQPSK